MLCLGPTICLQIEEESAMMNIALTASRLVPHFHTVIKSHYDDTAAELQVGWLCFIRILVGL